MFRQFISFKFSKIPPKKSGILNDFWTYKPQLEEKPDCNTPPPSLCMISRPDLIDMEVVSRQSNRENLEQAFEIAESLGVTRLLDAEGETVV